MAFPASTGRLAPTLDAVCGELVNLKALCQTRRDQMAAGDVPASTVIDLWQRLYAARARLQSAAAVPGIGPYAQAQFGDDQLDVAAEFNAVVSALTGVLDNITGTFPVDGSGYLLRESFGAGALTQRVFSSAATAGLRTALDTFTATVA